MAVTTEGRTCSVDKCVAVIGDLVLSPSPQNDTKLGEDQSVSSRAGLPLQDLDWLEERLDRNLMKMSKDKHKSLARGKDEHPEGCGADLLERPEGIMAPSKLNTSQQCATAAIREDGVRPVLAVKGGTTAEDECTQRRVWLNMWETHTKKKHLFTMRTGRQQCTAQRGCALAFLGGFPKPQLGEAQGNLVWPHGWHCFWGGTGDPLRALPIWITLQISWAELFSFPHYFSYNITSLKTSAHNNSPGWSEIMLTQCWITSQSCSPFKSANPPDCGDYFTNPLYFHSPEHVLTTHTQKHLCCFINMPQRLERKGLETCRFQHLDFITSLDVMVANNRRKNKQKSPEGLVSHTWSTLHPAVRYTFVIILIKLLLISECISNAAGICIQRRRSGNVMHSLCCVLCHYLLCQVGEVSWLSPLPTASTSTTSRTRLS